MDEIAKVFREDECQVIENDSGLHFLLRLNTDIPDELLEQKLLKKKIRLQSLASFYHMKNSGEVRKSEKTDMTENTATAHMFIVNYSNIDSAGLDKALRTIRKEMRG
jgi:GntR family transcriptional regulator/MocR family aminotransferase